MVTCGDMWKAVCCLTLLFGMETVSLSKIALKNIESTQGSLIKQSLGLIKYSHHSKILTALNVSRCVETVNPSVEDDFQSGLTTT